VIKARRVGLQGVVEEESGTTLTAIRALPVLERLLRAGWLMHLPRDIYVFVRACASVYNMLALVYTHTHTHTHTHKYIYI